jgi:excisionase family DNA binding protein
MTVKQAAQRLEISPSLCYRLIEEKRLTCVRIGGMGRRGKIIVTEDDIKRFMESLRAA